MKRFWNTGAGGGSKMSFIFLKLIFVLSMTMVTVTSAARRQQRLIPAAPTPEALRNLADSMGAATFEELTVDALAADSIRSSPKDYKNDAEDQSVEYQTYQGVMGRPGIDFPVFPSIPQTFFDCSKVATGYYADLETDCQVFHICDGGRKISFLCPNGTIFRQSNLICDWWFKVDCSESPGQYEESAEHLAEDQRRAVSSNKQPIPIQNFDTIHTTNRRTDIGYDTTFNAADNHVAEYKAEASFNTVAKSGAPQVVSHNRQEQKTAQRANPRSFQVTKKQDLTPNSRQHSTLDHTDKYDVSAQTEESRRRATINNYHYTSTRRNVPDYTDAAIYRSTTKSPKVEETQVVAESASFASNRGKNNYYHYSSLDNRIRSTIEPSYSPSSFTPPKNTKSTYTTTYIPGSKNYVEVTRSTSHSITSTIRPQSPAKSTLLSIPSTASAPSEYRNEKRFSNKVEPKQTSTSSIPLHNIGKTTTSFNNDARFGKVLKSQINNNIIGADKGEPKNTNLISTKIENVTLYAPTVPTVTPKAFNASTNKFLATNWYSASHIDTTTPTEDSYQTQTTEPTASEHAVEMLKTLEELDLENSEPTTETEKFLGRRPGLFVPPSAGPNTLHSLAIYFATAVDNLVTTTEPTTIMNEEQYSFDEKNQEPFSSILTRNTLNKYMNLFKNETNDDDDALDNAHSEEIDNNDLESSQSKGPLASSPQIRELAQVFTHALSAYLQDPETFRKVLSEIRPTEPTTVEEPLTTSRAIIVADTTPSSDFYSSAKEEDEVLDFSDVSKNSPNPTIIPTEPTTPVTEATKAYSIDLIKHKLLLSTGSYRTQNPTTYSEKINRTPASGIITQQTDDLISRQGKELSTTSSPPTSNAVAVEINGGLTNTATTYTQTVNNIANRNNDFDTNSSYFPSNSGEYLENTARYGGFQNNSSEIISPYGEGVKPSNATPINGIDAGSLIPTEAIPLHWGDIISTTRLATQLNPSAPSFDLVPPSSISKQIKQKDSENLSELNSLTPEDINNLDIEQKPEYIPTTTTEKPISTTIGLSERERINNKYKSHSADRGKYYTNFKISNDNDEQLQRAHSQSFVASANQIGRRGKKIEPQGKTINNEEYDDVKESKNKTFTVKISTGEVLTLPTLKDILSKPTSTAPTTNNFEDLSTSVATQQPTTVLEETTTEFAHETETTEQYETSTTLDTSKYSTKSQTSTSQSNIWSTSAALGHIWQTTVFLDPMTINEGLTSDDDQETIQPSANTYRSGSLKNEEHSSVTEVTQETGASQYSAFTTPYTTTNVEEYTTKPFEEKTTYYEETKSYEAFPPTHPSYFENITPDEVENTESHRQREGKSLSTPASSLLLERLNKSDVDETMMTKAKEMFGGLNESSANTLMNVMKNADKNKTVRRLILLLVQTCDDDHNKTIEASRTALLDALMKIPAEENDSIVSTNPTQSSNNRSTPVDTEYSFDKQKVRIESRNSDRDFYNIKRSDEIIETEDTKFSDLAYSRRKGKKIDNFSTVTSPVEDTTIYKETITPVTTELPAATSTDTQYISSSTIIPVSRTSIPITSTSTPIPSLDLSTSSTSAPTSSTSAFVPISTVSSTKVNNRRGNRKYYSKSTKTTQESTAFTTDERGSVSSLEDQSVPSDTRALELLRSLYSLAARWG